MHACMHRLPGFYSLNATRDEAKPEGLFLYACFSLEETRSPRYLDPRESDLREQGCTKRHGQTLACKVVPKCCGDNSGDIDSASPQLDAEEDRAEDDADEGSIPYL